MLSIWTCKNYCYISLTGKIRRQTSFPSQPRNLLPKGQAVFEVQHLKVRLMYMHRVDKSPWYSEAINKTKTSLPWLKWWQGSSGETARVAFSIKQLFFYLHISSIFPSDRKWHTVSLTSFPSSQSFLTFIFVKQIALNMSKTLEWSVSQILKIKMIHKDSICVYNHHGKISRKKSQSWSFRAQHKVVIFGG